MFRACHNVLVSDLSLMMSDLWLSGVKSSVVMLGIWLLVVLLIATMLVFHMLTRCWGEAGGWGLVACLRILLSFLRPWWRSVAFLEKA